MNVTPTAEQVEFSVIARRFLEEVSEAQYVRRSLEQEVPFDRDLWRRIADMGWLSLGVPEEYGGARTNMFDIVVLMEEVGRALFPATLFSTVCLGAAAILMNGDESQKAAYLPSIVRGEAIVSLAVCEDRAGWDGSNVETRAERGGGGWLLNGTKLFVPDGSDADVLVVLARTDAGPTLFLVDATAPGVTRRTHETMDRTRRLAQVDLDGVMVRDSATLGTPGTAIDTLLPVLQRAAVGLAAEQVGGAQCVLDMSVTYAKSRMQFDRPIGSFQAIKHKCADMLLKVETARSATYYAAWTADEAPEDLPVAASLAKAYCSEAYYYCAAQNIQIHGGIGFTWEHDAHLYFKRAASSQILLGSPEQHRELIAGLLNL